MMQRGSSSGKSTQFLDLFDISSLFMGRSLQNTFILSFTSCSAAEEWSSSLADDMVKTALMRICETRRGEGEMNLFMN